MCIPQSEVFDDLVSMESCSQASPIKNSTTNGRETDRACYTAEIVQQKQQGRAWCAACAASHVPQELVF